MRATSGHRSRTTPPSSARWLLVAASLALGCGGSSCGSSSATSGVAGVATSSASEDAALRARLAAAYRAKGPDYVPRTRHKNPDGTPKYTNRLLLESSPYLLQHAHNPVDWHPWGEEAFAKARAEGKPVFLSVGYSTCHWCHVMEEESFEDEEIARFLNAHYVPVKVDREERPDVDAVYMTALLSWSGGGGWPMSLWLTPEREPFFAGTYFPPRDGVRGARRGFLSILRELSTELSADPAAVRRDARAFAERVKKLAAPDAAGDLPGPSAITAAVAKITPRFDPENGGLRGAPKFPSSFPVRLFLRHARRAGDAASLRMATETLDHIAAGGIRDHLGGGFHRYATDARWRIPHFEKMLYDNALLALTYLEAAQATGEARFTAIARETLDYLLREMTAPDGTFHAATDADSLAPSGKREEGWFFTWTPAEIEAALDGDAERAALAAFGVTAAGNLDGRNVLTMERPPADVIKDLGWDGARSPAPPAAARTADAAPSPAPPAAARTADAAPSIATRTADAAPSPSARYEAALASARAGLFAARKKRPPPLRDEKVIVAWNALAVSAFARAAIVLGDAAYAKAAERAALVLVRDLRAGKPLPHTLVAGVPSGRGFLDDHTALALAALDLLELTADPAWLRDALTLMDRVEKAFADRANGGYFLTADDAEALLLRDKPSDDGPTPSGNSMAALAWLRLAVITGDDRHRAAAETTLRAFAAPLAGRPASIEYMLHALDFATDSPKEIAIVLPDGPRGALSAAARPLLDVLARTFVPSSALVVASVADLAGPLGEALPWAKEKPAKSGRPTAYVCVRGACKLPVTEPADLAKTLAEHRPYSIP